MTESSYVVKFYLLNSDTSIKEIRKFPVHKSIAKNLNMLCEKIEEMFPELRPKAFTISWQDAANDEILISSDAELRIALTEMSSEIKLRIKLASEEQESPRPKVQEASCHYKKEEVMHNGIVCDGCNANISGFRYKCIQCDDYDLCSQCERNSMHSQHYMIRIPQPLHWHYSRSLQHHLRKILKKNSTHSCKKQASNERTFKGSHCVSSFLEAFPDLNSILDMLLQDTTCNPDPTKQPENPSTSQTQKAEKEKESKEGVDNDDSASKKFPGEGKKLLDDTKDDKGCASDTSDASDTSQNSPEKKIAADEWTIVDAVETVETNPTPSAPEVNTSNQKIYPQLPEEKTEVHHPNPVINKAVQTMIEMGFSNQDKLLTYLLAAENGDINRVIEILQPTKQ